MNVLKSLFAAAFLAALVFAGSGNAQANTIRFPVPNLDPAGIRLSEQATPVHYRHRRIGGLRNHYRYRRRHYRHRYYGHRYKRRYYARRYHRRYYRRHYRKRYYGYYGPSIYIRVPGFGFHFGY